MASLESYVKFICPSFELTWVSTRGWPWIFSKKKKIFHWIRLSHFLDKKLKLVMRAQLHFLVAGAASATACWPLLCSRGLSRRASWGCLLQPSRLSLEASRLCLLIYRVLHFHSALKASPRRKACRWRSGSFSKQRFTILQMIMNVHVCLNLIVFQWQIISNWFILQDIKDTTILLLRLENSINDFC